MTPYLGVMTAPHFLAMVGVKSRKNEADCAAPYRRPRSNGWLIFHNSNQKLGKTLTYEHKKTPIPGRNCRARCYPADINHGA